MRRRLVTAKLGIIIFAASLVASVGAPLAIAQVSGLDGIFVEEKLLLSDNIRKELILSDKQIQMTSDLVNQFVLDVGDLTKEKIDGADAAAKARLLKRAEKIYALRVEAQKKVEELLSKPQTSRLKQLSLQWRRFMVFRTPPVQKALGLSDAQKKEFASLIEKAFAAQPALSDFKKAHPERTSEELKKPWLDSVREYDKVTMSRMMEVLAEDQRAKWAGMTGPPFEFEL